MTEALLEVEQIEVVYDRVIRAVQGISLRVPAAATVALIGLNGAGKTTSLRAISGFLPSEDAMVTQGHIKFAGREITGWRPHQTAELGLVIVPPSVTPANVFDLFPSLAQHRRREAIWLSGGERQLLAIATSLMKRPRLLLVDEMSLGLSPSVQAQVIEKLKTLRSQLGFSLLLVDQDARAVLEASDYGYVIENGMIVRDGRSHELLNNSEVQEFYLGIRAGADTSRSNYRDVKQYRRNRRWWG
jgi:branched-chain amino acid transport system ATP-binding protein